jgi:hypothetical protein
MILSCFVVPLTGFCILVLLFPRTTNRWLQLALMVIAWIFAIITIGSCAFVGLPGYSDSKGLGLFSVDINGSCVRYSRTIWYEPDGARSAGQAFGTLTCLALSFGLVAHALVLYVVRDRLAQLVWMTNRVLLAVAFLCAMFTFSFYSSTLVADICESADDCVLGPAGSVGVMNIWLLLAIFTLSVCIPIPEQPILDVYDAAESKDAKINSSFETPKRSNETRRHYRGRNQPPPELHEHPEETATDDDEDLTNRHSRSSSNLNSNEPDEFDTAAVVAAGEGLFAADPIFNNNNNAVPSLRSNKSEDLDDEAVDRAFNPYGCASVRSADGEDDPSIITVSESNFSHLDRQFKTRLPDPEAQEEPSRGRRRRDPC